MDRKQGYALTTQAARPAVALFSRGATAARQRLLEELDQDVPGFKFDTFLPGRPGVFVVFIDGVELRLRLADVEYFVAFLRLGLATMRRELTEQKLTQILAHQF